VRPANSTRRALGDTIAHLAEQTAIAIAQAITLGIEPPAAVYFAERDLSRWAHALRGTDPTRPSLPSGSRLVAVAHLVVMADDRDPTALAETIVRTAGRVGAGWHITHTTTALDPAAIFTGPGTTEEGGA
jgi:hypothetical protein